MIYVWNQNHEGNGLILFVAVEAENENEARGKVLTDMSLCSEAVEMVRKSNPNVNAKFYRATWDTRRAAAPSADASRALLAACMRCVAECWEAPNRSMAPIEEIMTEMKQAIAKAKAA